MRAFYLSRIKQVEVDALGLVNMHRLQELGVQFTGGGLAVGEDGLPLHGYTVACVDVKDHSALEKDPELVRLADGVDVKAALMRLGATKGEADARVKADTAATIESIGKLNEGAFSVAKYGS